MATTRHTTTMTMLQLRRPFLLLLVISTVVCKSFVIQPGVWRYKDQAGNKEHPVAFEQARVVSSTTDESVAAKLDTADDETPILLLNGFGVGSFHQHRLIDSFLSDDSVKTSRSIYTIDYLGQGKSWPDDCNDGTAASEQGLCYSGNTWVDQITQFIENVVVTKKHAKVHIVGNSVGGHLGVFLAAARPDLVESLVLLNATPVWGLNLPGWSGHLPAPAIPKWIGRYLFDRIRDLNTIEAYLAAAYANVAAFDNELMQQIRGCTTGQGGHAAFSSILWSPPIKVQDKKGEMANFDDCLEALECDALLLFGRDDPWCKPAFAKRMLKSLSKRSDRTVVHRYIELSNVGHCPNHEAPTAVSKVLHNWVAATDDRSPHHVKLLQAESETVRERWGETTARERHESEIPVSTMDRIATTFV